MNDEKRISQVEPPSMAKILAATVVALIVAVVVLTVAVLPAEYGIDPLGAGKALGLTELAGASGSEAPVTTDAVAIAPTLQPSVNKEAPRVLNSLIARPSRYKNDAREYQLEPGEGMEIKYNMKKGSGLIYSWEANAKLAYEFHGEPNVKPPGMEGTDYYETYDLDDKEGKDQSHGTFVAPTSGIHGWFWENKGTSRVTLKIATSGFYDWVMQNRNEKQTALEPMDPYAGPSHPKIPDVVVK